MIITKLIDELAATFAREKRAQVCLWFDERGEFDRLLPALRAHLATLAAAPFTLLAYDESAGHGQLWIRAQIDWEGRDLPPDRRAARRFVVYLPFPPERLRGPESSDEPADERRAPWLEFLHQYDAGGVRWRVEGRDPTLFTFLRSAGVNLPREPREQRALWQGGRDSLLARFAARHAHDEAAFWSTVWTAPLVQDRLLGDVESLLLEWAMSPAAVVADLQDRGLLEDLLARVYERFDFNPSDDVEAARDPVEWIGRLVTHLSLCEVFEAFGRPEDFPYRSRLPAVNARPEALNLLRRWLKDGGARACFDELIEAREPALNLAPWAQSKRAAGVVGRPYALPGLARDRWRDCARRFLAVAPHRQQLDAFLRDERPALKDEEEFARSSRAPQRGWGLLADLGVLLGSCDAAQSELDSCVGAADHAALYVRHARRCDLAHWQLVAAARELGDGDEEVGAGVAGAAERAYGEYVRRLNEAFFEALGNPLDVTLPGYADMRATMKRLWDSPGPFALVIVDALRYDCGALIADALGVTVGAEGDGLQAARAMVPTVTAMGMAAMVPGVDAVDGVVARVEVSGASLRLKAAGGPAAGKDLAARRDRLDLFESVAGARCMEIKAFEDAPSYRAAKGERLVVYGHDALDEIGHGEADTLIRHLRSEVDRLAKLVRRLHRAGFPVVHVVTDHGFLFVNEVSSASLPPGDVERVKDVALHFKERYALVKADTPVPLKTVAHSYDPAVRVVVPPSTCFLRAEKTFTHGGLSLQELIVPVITSRASAAAPRVDVTPELSTYEVRLPNLMLKVGLRVESPEATLFAKPVGRTVRVDLLRAGSSVVAKTRDVVIEPPTTSGVRVNAVVFLSDRVSLAAGDVLDLVVTDVETGERLSPPGMSLKVRAD